MSGEKMRGGWIWLLVVVIFYVTLIGVVGGCSPPESVEIDMDMVKLCDNGGNFYVCESEIPPSEGWGLPLNPIDALVTEKLFEPPDSYWLVGYFVYGLTPTTIMIPVEEQTYRTILLGDMMGVICWPDYAGSPLTFKFHRCELEE